MSSRINLINIPQLVEAGFSEDEATFITENREVCPYCPHLMLFHEMDRDEDHRLCRLDCCCQSVQFRIEASREGQYERGGS